MTHREVPLMPKFHLLDGRAKDGDPETAFDAAILDTADSEAEARRMGSSIHRTTDGIWWEYKLEGNALTDGKPRYDLPPMAPAGEELSRCYALGCATMKPKRLLMCSSHWRLVPVGIQRKVYTAAKRMKQDRRGYVDAIAEAREAVAKVERIQL